MRTYRDVRDRLAERTCDADGGCRNWTGSVNATGYGCIRRKNAAGDWKLEKAHRVAYELTHGEIPYGLCVLHRCDNPRCCNPDHLFLGTRKDNNEDMARKGRARSAGLRGERSSRAKLTDEAVRAIRRDPRSVAKIAAELGMTGPTIWAARIGKTWKHIT